LDRYKMPGGEEREYTETLAGALFAGVTPEFADDRLTVYAVSPPQSPHPYLELGPLNWGPLTEQNNVRYRAIRDGAAQLWLRHAERGAQVVIEYEGEGDGSVESSDGSIYPLPPAPEGASLNVALPRGVDLLLITVDGEIRVTRLRLQTP
jgi:hypothetical protein